MTGKILPVSYKNVRMNLILLSKLCVEDRCQPREYEQQGYLFSLSGFYPENSIGFIYADHLYKKAFQAVEHKVNAEHKKRGTDPFPDAPKKEEQQCAY